MAKRGAKISKVLRLAEVEERRCGELAGRSRAELKRQQDRLEELDAYRDGYAASKFDNIDAAHWKDYQSFLGRLDQAVRSQQQIVRDCEQNLERHRQEWLTKRQKRESLENIVERLRHDERSHEERLEQRKLDDLPRAASPYADADDK